MNEKPKRWNASSAGIVDQCLKANDCRGIGALIKQLDSFQRHMANHTPWRPDRQTPDGLANEIAWLLQELDEEHNDDSIKETYSLLLDALDHLGYVIEEPESDVPVPIERSQACLLAAWLLGELQVYDSVLEREHSQGMPLCVETVGKRDQCLATMAEFGIDPGEVPAYRQPEPDVPTELFARPVGYTDQGILIGAAYIRISWMESMMVPGGLEAFTVGPYAFRRAENDHQICHGPSSEILTLPLAEMIANCQAAND